MDWVWNHSRSKGVGRLVLLTLADKARTTAGDCKAYGSLRFLQQRANCTREAVIDALPVLYKLGELELVEGEKGRYGAMVYRLPKAVGYTRSAEPEPEIGRLTRPIGEDDRSAHPTDSTDEIGRLTRPGVVGSPDRFEGESVGSPDHTTSPPPRSTTSSTTDPSASQAPGGGGARYAAEAEFLENLPHPWGAGRPVARRLAPQLAEAITTQGWQLDDALMRQLTRNPNGINNYAAVLPKRIAELPKNPTTRTQPRASPLPARQLPPWCEDLDCDEDTRQRTWRDEKGFVFTGPCHCHPDHEREPAA